MSAMMENRFRLVHLHAVITVIELAHGQVHPTQRDNPQNQTPHQEHSGCIASVRNDRLAPVPTKYTGKIKRPDTSSIARAKKPSRRTLAAGPCRELSGPTAIG
jgi:hypothetical protein